MPETARQKDFITALIVGGPRSGETISVEQDREYVTLDDPQPAIPVCVPGKI